MWFVELKKHYIGEQKDPANSDITFQFPVHGTGNIFFFLSFMVLLVKCTFFHHFSTILHSFKRIGSCKIDDVQLRYILTYASILFGNSASTIFLHNANS